MNYTLLYDSIIKNANTTTGYTENHHIIPKSLGGSDDKSNIVRLSAREHFICHYLLVKMYKENTNEWYKMVNAFMPMKASSGTQQRYFNSRLYEALRVNFSKVQSKSQTGEKNSNFGTKWIHHVVLKQSIKIPKEDMIPKGWIKGRIMNFDNYLNKSCTQCGTKFRSRTGNKSLCSKPCKKAARRPSYIDRIDRDFSKMVAYWQSGNSKAKTLRDFGYKQKKGEGSKYFTTKLKEAGHE